MEKQSQVQNVNKTNKNRFRKLRPILFKGIGGVIALGSSLLIKANWNLNIYTYVCPSDQGGKTLIRVDLSTKKVADWENFIIPPPNNRE